MIGEIDLTHGTNAAMAFERSVRVLGERRQFWARFCEVPDVEIDTAAVVGAWNAGWNAVREQLLAKQGWLMSGSGVLVCII